MRKATGERHCRGVWSIRRGGAGIYGYLVTREMIKEAYSRLSCAAGPYGAAEIIRTCRGLLLEFGPAECWIPATQAAGDGRLHRFSVGTGIVLGKVVADVAFYLPVIWIYERRRQYSRSPSPSP